MSEELEKIPLFYLYPTALGYRCFDGKEWHDCDKYGNIKEKTHR